MRLAMRLIPAALLLTALSVPALAEDTPVAEPDSAAFAEMFPEGLPSLLTPESMTRAYRLPSGVSGTNPSPQKPPELRYSDGPVKFAVGAHVAPNKPTASLVPAIPDPKIAGAAGGAGEVKGEIRLTEGQWELYGTQKYGVVQADGALPAPQDSTTFGSLYRLPDWMGGKVGASLEIAPTDERKTRVEYRRTFGPAEGFVAAEQTFGPNRAIAKDPPTTVRGGLSRKF